MGDLEMITSYSGTAEAFYSTAFPRRFRQGASAALSARTAVGNQRLRNLPWEW